MTTTIYLDEEHIEGLLAKAGDREVRLCKFGWELFVSCKWSITYTHYYLHLRLGRIIVPFHRLVLGLHGTEEVVRFKNGNTLDYRLCNLATRTVVYRDMRDRYIP